MQLLFAKLKENETSLFTAVFIILISLRIWLITGIPMVFSYAPHDDLYFAKAADYILHGQWMGPYGNMTLIKGPFYSFFMIFSFFTGLPLLFNETMFYITACIVMYFAIAPLIKNRWWRFLLFGLLLFSPASLAIAINIRVWRGFVYYSLTLFVIAFSVGLVLRVDRKLSSMICWACGLGLSMGAFMLTREEGVWIYPMLLLLLVSCVAVIWYGNMEHKWLRSAIVFCSIIIWYIPILTVSYLNYSHYGFWGYSETLDNDFNRVINTLGRIKTDVWYPYSSVTRESLDQAYAVSPLMAKLKPAIDASWDGWLFHSDNAIAGSPDWYRERYFVKSARQIGSGHFLWLFRDVLKSNGYYSSGRYPLEYLKALADQLQTACDSAVLECYPALNIPMVGSLRPGHSPIIFHYFLSDIYELLRSGKDRLDINSLDVKAWPPPQEEFIYFKEFVYNPMQPQEKTEAKSYGKGDIRLTALKYKVLIMKGILSVYEAVTLPGSIILCLAWFVWLIFNLIRRHRIHSLQGLQELQVFLFMLGLLFSREMTLAISAATSGGSFVTYSMSNYLFIYIILFLMLFHLSERIGQVVALGREKTRGLAENRSHNE